MRKKMEHTVSSNILKRQFQQIVPFKAFCTDITYLRFLGGFVYVSVVKDVASGEAVAWNVSLYMDMVLVIETIKNLPQELCKDALIHSDQGFQYTSSSYIEILRELGMIQSMSEKGKCLDNAPIESFFGHMKDELDYKSCKTFEDLRLRIEEYMRYYNYERKQWTRNKMTPVEYRNHLLSEEPGFGVSKVSTF